MRHLKSLTWRWLAAAASTLLAVTSALALPGAHGPNGEHLDGPAQTSTSASPRLEAKSELFEMVATLSGGKLSILVDRFETNEPVLGAKVEVEAGAVKAVAAFHADHGDYAVADPAFLKALAQPGEHAMVFTVIAGEQTDLLDGMLKVSAGTADHLHEHGPSLRTIALGVLAGVVLLSGLIWLLRTRRSRRNALPGGAA